MTNDIVNSEHEMWTAKSLWYMPGGGGGGGGTHYILGNG